MEEIFDNIILGIIQGLAEFLPISSSGHLELTKEILGFDKFADENQSMLVTVVLHVATALSTIVVYRKEIGEILSGLFSFKWNEQTIFSLKIVLSMIPAAIVGVVFNDVVESFFSGKILLVGVCLVATAALLLLADKAKSTDKPVSYLDSVLIGVAQAIAILPGVSRSGATISTSVLLGIDRVKAARFSFLMAVPLILGKAAKDSLDGTFDPSQINVLAISSGFVAAFITGVIACTWMIKLVQKSQLKYFSVYCFLVGVVAIGYSII